MKCTNGVQPLNAALCYSGIVQPHDLRIPETEDAPFQPSREIQESTFQVPVGEHSIFDALLARTVTEFQAIVYLNTHACLNWNTGQSHALSYTRIAKEIGVDRSYVVRAVKGLCEKGWLTKNLRGGGRANTYEVTHHLCEHQDVPRDKDGLPKKCAMPRGEGSAFDKLKKGKIHWKACLHFMVFKIASDWTSGIISMTIQQVQEWLRFSKKTICDIRKSLQSVGLLERLSKPFKPFSAQLYPKPYEKRRTRRRENPKGLPQDGAFFYSYNGLWRLRHENGQFQTLIKGTRKWRDANEFECEQANSKIHADFMEQWKTICATQDAPFKKARA